MRTFFMKAEPAQSRLPNSDGCYRGLEGPSASRRVSTTTMASRLATPHRPLLNRAFKRRDVGAMALFFNSSHAGILLPQRVQCRRREASSPPRITMSLRPFGESVYRHEIEAAIEVVERACHLCITVQGSMLSDVKEQLNKSDHSPVTIADFGVQSLVSMELGILFPDIPLIGEEDASYLRREFTVRDKEESEPLLVDKVVEAVSKVASPRVGSINTQSVLDALDRGGQPRILNMQSSKQKRAFWVLDPIDGTHGFLRGEDALYVIGLALVVEDNLILGVMGVPCLTVSNMKESKSGQQLLQSIDGLMSKANVYHTHKNGIIMAACRGHGCWVKPLEFGFSFMSEKRNLWEKSSVDCRYTLDNALFALSQHEDWGSSVLAHIAAKSGLPDSETALKDNVFSFCCGSLCKYFAIAIGAVSVLLVHQSKEYVKVWDHAAGVICISEAGGKVTDKYGTDLEKYVCRGETKFVPGGGSILVTNGHLHAAILEGMGREMGRKL